MIKTYTGKVRRNNGVKTISVNAVSSADALAKLRLANERPCTAFRPAGIVYSTPTYTTKRAAQEA